MPKAEPPSVVAPPEFTAASPRAGALWQRRLDYERKWRLSEGDETDYRSFPQKFAMKSAEWLLRLTGFYTRGRRNTLDFVMEEHAFWYPDLPEALDHFRILHLSDPHFSVFDREFTHALASFLAGTTTDLCLITGDYRYGYFGPADYVAPLMREVIEGIDSRHGFYGIMGNHDVSDLIAPLEALGIRMLLNHGELLSHEGADLWIGGVDDAHWFRCASVPDAAAGAPEEAFKILLAHTPENVEEGAACGFDLCLSGHTHGGQLVFPVVGPPKYNARCDRAFNVGKWRCGGLQGYTSRGLGTTDIPVRYNCRPEATTITLRMGNQE